MIEGRLTPESRRELHLLLRLLGSRLGSLLLLGRASFGCSLPARLVLLPLRLCVISILLGARQTFCD